MHFGSAAKRRLLRRFVRAAIHWGLPKIGEGEKFMKLMKATLMRLWRLTRATSIAVSLAVVVALAGGVVSQALAAPTGGSSATAILKGVSNTANTVTTLVNSGPGSALRLEAMSPTEPALDLKVAKNMPPLKVNEDAGKAINLSADKLDGKEATEFLGTREKALESFKADHATNADKLDGKEAAMFLGATEKAVDSLKADHATNADKAANADKLDEMDSKDFLAAEAKALDSFKADQATHAANADQAINSEKLGGRVAADFLLKEAKALESFKADEATHAANAANADNSDKLDGKDSTDFFRNWQRVEGEKSALNSEFIKGSIATCPVQGQMVVGGGYQISRFEAGTVTVLQSSPSPDGNAWFVMAEEIGAGTTVDWDVQAYAICADV
jgi:hypothetical protein